MTITYERDASFRRWRDTLLDCIRHFCQESTASEITLLFENNNLLSAEFLHNNDEFQLIKNESDIFVYLNTLLSRRHKKCRINTLALNLTRKLTSSFESRINSDKEFDDLLKEFEEYYSLIPETETKEMNSFIEKYTAFQNNSVGGGSSNNSTKKADLSTLRRHDLAEKSQPIVNLWDIETDKMKNFIIRRLFRGNERHFEYFMSKFEPKLKTIRRLLCFKKLHEGEEGSVSERFIVQPSSCGFYAQCYRRKIFLAFLLGATVLCLPIKNPCQSNLSPRSLAKMLLSKAFVIL